ncbi:MAG: PD-(D/E)XK nuclease family protein, partial [Terriglobales bacterium]
MRGEEPPVWSIPSTTRSVYGTEFHAMARKVTCALRADAHADEEDYAQLLQRVWSAGGSGLLESLLLKGDVESAGYVTTACHAFCERLLQLKGVEGKLRRFSDIFVQEEHKLKDVAHPTYIGNLYVSGAIDCVRMAPDGAVEVVDYKLTKGEQLAKEMIQVALYRRLLLARDRHLRVHGFIEYFLPELRVTPLGDAALEAAFEDVVAPV